LLLDVKLILDIELLLLVVAQERQDLVLELLLLDVMAGRI
jgi:hypothetical protein